MADGRHRGFAAFHLTFAIQDAFFSTLSGLIERDETTRVLPHAHVGTAAVWPVESLEGHVDAVEEISSLLL